MPVLIPENTTSEIKTGFNKIPKSHQIHMNNYVQESLKHLREKAREHETELKNQLYSVEAYPHQHVHRKMKQTEEFVPIQDENKNENCHIYENFKPRAKSVENCLSLDKGDDESKIPGSHFISKNEQSSNEKSDSNEANNSKLNSKKHKQSTMKKKLGNDCE